MSEQNIPIEILDLVRFLAETWKEIDDYVCEYCENCNIDKYPKVQGTPFQMLLREIGSQPYDKEKLSIADHYLSNQSFEK